MELQSVRDWHLGFGDCSVHKLTSNYSAAAENAIRVAKVEVLYRATGVLVCTLGLAQWLGALHDFLSHLPLKAGIQLLYRTSTKSSLRIWECRSFCWPLVFVWIWSLLFCKPFTLTCSVLVELLLMIFHQNPRCGLRNYLSSVKQILQGYLAFALRKMWLDRLNYIPCSAT